ncbi:ATP-NAD kinase family protein [Trichomonas vaginalis G3]|uniref:ATP-NAD kinase family protein n=1 Tax=Trichomonas vaginalis (strain ATCC PRA-98 / G3) TaxID=412133 RepID=A2EED9_TRIV3|nr:NADP biosynthetic process [Trichomonas vaginalis G3]EAY08945.1 ATP-NAD kinase family protein [Trichomonas vaginalis G3]KAI5508606.1 NADP biosynthetic process [Trichomonas vaginalis G3]|eukprot:XP_001321168.1 ATP-NAD kinase family protein [Trichomonas vaginalis G3]
MQKRLSFFNGAVLESCSRLDDIIPKTNFRVSPFSLFGEKDGSMHLEWIHRPSTCLLIEKINDKVAREYLIKSADFLAKVKHFTVYVEQYLYDAEKAYTFWQPYNTDQHGNIDFILIFGGDGTLLHASYLFNEFCPPILSFAAGSLGFLTQFQMEEYKDAIDDLIRGVLYINSRTRLFGELKNSEDQILDTIQATNDIVIMPTIASSVCSIDAFIDGEYFTTVIGDGLIVSTATGSTAYNLSAGGCMVHPSVSSILFTPICGHSLNTQPIVLPDCCEISFKISESGRTNSPYNINYDSKRTTISKGNELCVRISAFPLPTVCKQSPIGDWLHSISTVLRWNQPMINMTADNNEAMKSCNISDRNTYH